ncbi:MAG TPA: RidA family protein [Candidatus Polarisedimenticolia bacterium]|jgi:enamine deaminase RidA (YjgF/YER057c/UK114 family)
MEFVNPDALARPVGYSHGAMATGRLLAVAGQVGWDGKGRIVGEGFVAQFSRALANVIEVVRAAGGGPHHLIRLTIYVTARKDYLASLNPLGEEYRRLMGRHYPAMTLVEVKGLLEPGAKVEIEGLAVLQG